MKCIAYISAALLIPAAMSYAVTDNSPEVLNVVSSFYEEYTANYEKPLVNYNQIDPSYVEKVVRMEARAARAEPEVGGLDFDPVTWGHDVSDRFTYGSPVVESTGAMVTVTKTPDNRWLPASHICVSLQITQDGWKIVDTLDPQFFEKKDCTSYMPGFPFPEIDFDHPRD
ncbi:MAG: hypothetical protein MJ061_04390 [Mailhella sp.]|nr:hypothetical protein [Mailhella sp.]